MKREYGPPNPTEQELREAKRKKNLLIALSSDNCRVTAKAIDELAKDVLQRLRPNRNYHL